MRNPKRALCLLLTLCMTLTFLSMAVHAAAPDFEISQPVVSEKTKPSP